MRKFIAPVLVASLAFGGCTLTLPGTSSSVTVSGGSSPSVNAVDWTAILEFGRAAALELCAIKPTLSTISDIIITRNGKNINTNAAAAKAEADAAATVFCAAAAGSPAAPAPIVIGDKTIQPVAEPAK